MLLRKAGPGDKKNILEIINLLRLDIPGFVWAEDEFVDRQIKNGEYFLVENDGKIAGAMSLRQREDRMYIETLAVEADHRLLGIGTRLVEYAKQVAKEKGMSSLCACSFFEYNASDFYLKLGFSPRGRPGKYKGREYNRFGIDVQ